MKKQISRTLLGFAILFVLVASASAQTTRGIEIQVPFGFSAGQKQLPAGHYTVRRIRIDSETALLIQSMDRRAAVTVLTTSGGHAPSDASLSFRQYGDRYFLAGVSMPGTASVREVPKTNGERMTMTGRVLIEQARADGVADKMVTIVGTVR
jgi:hypothetical protein